MGLNRIWIIVIFALAVGGCSRFKLLYSFSGEAIESEVGYFLDLNEDEQTALEAKVVDLLDWHRVQMLPRYADFLRRTAEEVDAWPLEEATVRQAVGDLRQLLRATMEGASPFIADVLVHHTNPKKLDHLRSRMAERNAERRRALEAGELPGDEQLYVAGHGGLGDARLKPRLPELVARCVDAHPRLCLAGGDVGRDRMAGARMVRAERCGVRAGGQGWVRVGAAPGSCLRSSAQCRSARRQCRPSRSCP